MTQHNVLPPDHDRDFHQLTGAFDRPVAPAPAFAERLKQQIAQSGAEKGAPSMQASAPTQLHATRMNTGQVTAMPDPGRRIVRILEATAAAILILALIGGGFFLNRNGNDDNPVRLAALPATSTPELATPASTTSAFTDPGHTNAYPAGFDPDTAQPAELLSDVDFNSDSGLIVDDTLVLFGHPEDASNDGLGYLYNTIGVDLTTGEQLWNKSRGVVNAPAVGKHAFYTIEMSSAGSEDVNFMLVSVSPETGLPNWGHTFATLKQNQLGSIPANSALRLGTPIEINGTVYLATGTGEVTAWQADSGEQLWQTSETKSTDLINAIGGSIVGNEHELYVVNDKNEIVRYDAQTGDILGTIRTDHPVSNDQLRLVLSDDILVVLSHDRMYIEPFSVGIEAYSTSGERLWQRDVPSLAGGTVITNGILGITHPAEGESAERPQNSVLSLIDLENGSELDTIEIPSWGGASLSASGSILCLHTVDPSISCDDVADKEFTPKVLDLNTNPETVGPQSPVLFWNDSAIIIRYSSGPYFIRSGNDVSRTATPVASPVEQQKPSATVLTDPGHTNAYPSGFDPDTAQPAQPLGDFGLDSAYGLVTDDTLVLLGTPVGSVSGPPVYVAIDLVTGRELWTAERNNAAIPVANEDVIFSLEGAPAGDDYEFDLIAIAAETGEPLWTQEALTIPGGTGLDVVSPYLRPLSSLVVIDDAVYVAKNSGDVTAFDASTGDELWKSAGWDDERDAGDVGGSLVGDDTYLYVVDGENEVQKLDRQSGEVVDTFAVNTRPGPDYMGNLLLQGDTLLMMSRPSQQGMSQFNYVDVLRASTGESLWSIKTGPLLGNPVVTDSIVGIPYIADLDGTPLAAPMEGMMEAGFYDLHSGELVSKYGPNESGTASLSAAGNVVCINEPTSSISCADFSDANPSLTGIDIGASYNAEGPPSPILFWNDSAIVLGHDGGPYIIRSRGNTPGATPAASPDILTSDFQPDYQSTGDLAVNLRWGPGIRYDVAATVSPETPLQILDESEPTRHPEEDGLTDGQEWLKVRTRSGEEGWIREVDITEFTP